MNQIQRADITFNRMPTIKLNGEEQKFTLITTGDKSFIGVNLGNQTYAKLTQRSAGGYEVSMFSTDKSSIANRQITIKGGTVSRIKTSNGKAYSGAENETSEPFQFDAQFVDNYLKTNSQPVEKTIEHQLARNDQALKTLNERVNSSPEGSLMDNLQKELTRLRDKRERLLEQQKQNREDPVPTSRRATEVEVSEPVNASTNQVDNSTKQVDSANSQASKVQSNSSPDPGNRSQVDRGRESEGGQVVVNRDLCLTHTTDPEKRAIVEECFREFGITNNGLKNYVSQYLHEASMHDLQKFWDEKAEDIIENHMKSDGNYWSPNGFNNYTDFLLDKNQIVVLCDIIALALRDKYIENDTDYKKSGLELKVEHEHYNLARRDDSKEIIEIPGNGICLFAAALYAKLEGKEKVRKVKVLN